MMTEEKPLGETDAESIVQQCQNEGHCKGNAPAGHAWVILSDGKQAYPDSKSWDWIKSRLKIAEYEQAYEAMKEHPSWVLFIPIYGLIRVIAPRGEQLKEMFSTIKNFWQCVKTYRDEKGNPTRPSIHTPNELGICKVCGADIEGPSIADYL